MTVNRLVPELVCSDIAESLRFYTSVVGFKVRYQREKERFAYLEREGAELMIEQPTGRAFVAASLQFPFGRGINLQIQVEDVVAVHSAVSHAGTAIYLPLEEKWYRAEDRLLGHLQFIVQDPDGYLLRFYQDLGSRLP